ncbi:hypothetical protein HK097_008227 [Rhizophlyctis rosea]|uniref:Uncharacterized protein n=1 Tax=Rhizophlyctis rosea TaxID=64517 RepID=A0AAD5SAJ8_9FUNG|nr:hypothetical protein HK097_008227 [Rhizophlyctis rosea]
MTQSSTTTTTDDTRVRVAIQKNDIVTIHRLLDENFDTFHTKSENCSAYVFLAAAYSPCILETLLAHWSAPPRSTGWLSNIISSALHYHHDFNEDLQSLRFPSFSPDLLLIPLVRFSPIPKSHIYQLLHRVTRKYLTVNTDSFDVPNYLKLMSGFFNVVPEVKQHYPSAIKLLRPFLEQTHLGKEITHATIRIILGAGLGWSGRDFEIALDALQRFCVEYREEEATLRIRSVASASNWTLNWTVRVVFGSAYWLTQAAEKDLQCQLEPLMEIRNEGKVADNRGVVKTEMTQGTYLNQLPCEIFHLICGWVVGVRLHKGKVDLCHVYEGRYDVLQYVQLRRETKYDHQIKKMLKG